MGWAEEVGRELLAHELLVRTVVVVGRDDRASFITAWVCCVDKYFVAFYMGETKTTLFVKRRKDNTMTDDTGTRIRVFEFLGEVHGQTKVAQ